MAKKKNKDYTIIWITLVVIAFILIFYMGSQGMFKSTLNVGGTNQPPIQVTPTPSQTVFSSCSQVCTQQGFDLGYYIQSFGNCKVGESKVNYGYAGQPPLLTCCCYDEVIPPPEEPPEGESVGCYDSDRSLPTIEERIQFAGYCNDYRHINYLDVCNWEKAVSEYACQLEGTPDAYCDYVSYNCEGMLGVGAYCLNGKCVLTPPSSPSIPLTSSECKAWADSLGKQSYNSDSSTMTSIDACGEFSWANCNSMGKTLLYFDYQSSCCVWSCT